MYSYIYSGDLSNMKDFDFSTLNGLLDVCTDITISQMGIHLWIDTKHITILGNKINFTFLGRTFKFDEVLIQSEVFGDIKVLDFTIRYGDAELFLSVVSDV